MIVASRLLTDCQRLVQQLEADLRERLADHPELDAPVRAEYDQARERGRTGQSYAVWREEYLTQVAVHWTLAAVFVRFLEDNGLLPEPWLSGPAERLASARDRQERFFAAHPAASDRDYLLACFRELRALPALASLFDERHNPLFQLGISADGARLLLDLFRKIDPASGALLHDFGDPAWNTRFLGDLYQDLSEAARKRYALLQTPEFVEEFILDRTLEPAMDEIGYRNVTMIDPACGSGHFVLGAFHRIFARAQAAEPGTDDRKLALRVLGQVAGVDANPFAIAIARFRLLIAALKVSEIRRLLDAPNFELNLAAADSLLFGNRHHIGGTQIPLMGKEALRHIYETEDAELAKRLLNRHYSVVVGNPPYITPRDTAENQAYRVRFGSCHRQYSLAIPFAERFFDLAETVAPTRPAGRVGTITANSFMKREFGKKLIETYIPRWDLTHIIDTSGAYIPGHGTPTVILIGRNQRPVVDTIRVVMGIRGEPGTPEDAAKGLVWSAIVAQINVQGSQSSFVSVADLEREKFRHHPWSLGGGGASELKDILEEGRRHLKDHIDVIGRTTHTGEDEAFYLPSNAAITRNLAKFCVNVVLGGDIRDWVISPFTFALFPYDHKSAEPLPKLPLAVSNYLWPLRTILRTRLDFGETPEQRGLRWFDHSMFFPNRYKISQSLAFAFVATHNHFVLDRGGKVFKQSAPAIKLPDRASNDDHLALLGLLNSSTACFWMKQMFFNRGSTVDQKGARQRTLPFEDFWEYDSTKLAKFPVSSDHPIKIAMQLDQLAQLSFRSSPNEVIRAYLPTSLRLSDVKKQAEQIQRRMIALQEELDWQVYRLYSLLEDPLEYDPDGVPEVALGERPFEIALARRVAAGEIETAWFERHGSTPITEIPARWPEPYRRLIEQRLKAIEENSWIRLIEQPEYKRRWNREPWEEQEKRALRGWLLDRLEDRRYWPEPRVTSVGRLADRLRQDDEFRQVAALYRARNDFDWTALVTELVADEGVPYLAAYRYAEAGQRKRAEWEKTWDLQRREDAIDARTTLPEGDPQRLTADEAKALKAREVGAIDVPPRYASTDFRQASFWRLRGKLDVPKERFILYPGLERGADPSPVLGWAGWNPLEQAQALGTAFNDLRENEGWNAERLEPLLAGLLELLPWLLQWHDEPDPDHGGERLGTYFKGFLDEEARALGFTREQLAAWRPAEKTKRGRKPKS
ncbi:MAG TPA: BREX-2 system adenine-specific DNA-methyltransferase PglX [Thermoanaerobaculia bacterium]